MTNTSKGDSYAKMLAAVREFLAANHPEAERATLVVTGAGAIPLPILKVTFSDASSAT